MEWEERKRRGKDERIKGENRQRKGGRERGGPGYILLMQYPVTYISTSTPIIQYGLTPLVLTG